MDARDPIRRLSGGPPFVASALIGLLLLLVRAGPGSLMGSDRGLYLQVTVKDEAGAPVPSAEITAEGFAAWAGRPVYTQTEGWAVLTNLEKGDYRLRVSAPHYNSVVYEDHLIASDHVELVLRRVPEAAPQSTVPTVSGVDLAAPAKAQAEYRKGMAQLQKRRYEKARQLFQAALGAYPSYSAAYAGLGTSLLQQGKRGEALEAFRQALRLNESCYEALVGSGLILNDFKRYAEAHRHLATAAGVRMNHPWPLYYELGRTHYGLDQLNDAEKNFQKAREAHPPYGNLYLLLANTFVLQQKYEQAIPELEEFLQIAPESQAAGEVRSKLRLLRAEVEKQKQ